MKKILIAVILAGIIGSPFAFAEEPPKGWVDKVLNELIFTIDDGFGGIYEIYYDKNTKFEGIQGIQDLRPGMYITLEGAHDVLFENWQASKVMVDRAKSKDYAFPTKEQLTPEKTKEGL